MISFSIFEVERQKFFIHATCFVILVNLNLIIFLFCPHFKYLPFPNVCHSSLYSAVKNIVSRIQNILSWLLQKHQGLAERCKTFRTRGGLRGDPVFWIVKRNLITPQWMEPPAVTSVAPDWTPSWIASIPNKYNPWICFVSIFDLPIHILIFIGNGSIGYPTAFLNTSLWLFKETQCFISPPTLDCTFWQ